MLDNVNGIGRMLDPKFRPVEVDAITETDDTGRRKNCIQFSETITEREKVKVEVVNADGSATPASCTRAMLRSAVLKAYGLAVIAKPADGRVPQPSFRGLAFSGPGSGRAGLRKPPPRRLSASSR